MGTRLFVLGIHTLVTLLAMMWLFQQVSSLETAILAPGHYAIATIAGLYWVYTSYRILSGKDLLARKAEEWLNSRK